MITLLYKKTQFKVILVKDMRGKILKNKNKNFPIALTSNQIKTYFYIC